MPKQIRIESLDVLKAMKQMKEGEKVSKVINHKHNYTYGDVPGLGECKCGNYRVFDRETQTYKEYEICLACSQSYPPNGILFCEECKGEGK